MRHRQVLSPRCSLALELLSLVLKHALYLTWYFRVIWVIDVTWRRCDLTPTISLGVPTCCPHLPPQVLRFWGNKQHWGRIFHDWICLCASSHNAQWCFSQNLLYLISHGITVCLVWNHGWYFSMWFNLHNFTLKLHAYGMWNELFPIPAMLFPSLFGVCARETHSLYLNNVGKR